MACIYQNKAFLLIYWLSDKVLSKYLKFFVPAQKQHLYVNG